MRLWEIVFYVCTDDVRIHSLFTYVNYVTYIQRHNKSLHSLVMYSNDPLLQRNNWPGRLLCFHTSTANSRSTIRISFTTRCIRDRLIQTLTQKFRIISLELSAVIRWSFFNLPFIEKTMLANHFTGRGFPKCSSLESTFDIFKIAILTESCYSQQCLVIEY